MQYFAEPYRTQENLAEHEIPQRPQGTSQNFRDLEETSKILRELRRTTADLGVPWRTIENLSELLETLQNFRELQRNVKEPWRT